MDVPYIFERFRIDTFELVFIRFVYYTEYRTTIQPFAPDNEVSMNKKDKLLTIGQFASMHGINKKTLMWYDEIGLFTSCYQP